MTGMTFAQITPTFFPESVGLFDVMKKGGSITWLILGCSIIAVGVIFERLLYFHRHRLNVPVFLAGVINLLRSHRYLEALERCDEIRGPVKYVVQTAIQRRTLNPMELREVVREVAQLQVPRLEANLPLLATVGYVSPLFGLLGTVLGMIEAFIKINTSSGAAPVGDLAGGIWTALITTAAGLMVAIPCHVAYNYFVASGQAMINDMERAAMEVIHLLTDPAHKDIIPMEPVKVSPLSVHETPQSLLSKST